uniref:Uncharacterized protein n=1 Tax=Strix occidentalis caurina TaxID=311401 RepID=A0A8D0EII4_STROC
AIFILGSRLPAQQALSRKGELLQFDSMQGWESFGEVCRGQKTQEEIPESALAGAAFPEYSLSCPTFTDYLCVGMYVPKTFTFLAAIVQRSRQVASLAVLQHGEEPEGIFS